MKWTKTSEYSITTGRFHIAKALVDGVPKYTLWDNTQIVGTWDTPEGAKNAALDIRHIPASAGGV
ncbi:hypothetical protein [Limnobacter sp.]|uniref:hypothetical protein n=1 Tax=Limnobacter sp. TaxID=2003368 RepID=UPI0027322C32|nr:hypothetical protein [Limnobacter sp.]MDP3273425.1 hypothetical protein [Limnobacter sp.]